MDLGTYLTQQGITATIFTIKFLFYCYHHRPNHIPLKPSRGNTVEPLSKVLEPISVRHLDMDSSGESTKEPRTEPLTKTPQDRKNQDTVPRRQMSSQLVRLGSIGKDPGVIGPLVWDLHCQRIKDGECTFNCLYWSTYRFFSPL